MKNIKTLLFCLLIAPSLQATTHDDLIDAIEKNDLVALEKSLPLYNIYDDDDSEEYPLLLRAIQQAHNVNAALVLIKAGANVNTTEGKGYSPLMRTFTDISHSFILIDALVNAGANINYRATYYDRSTPLMHAAAHPYAVMYCCWLIRRGANCNAKDCDQQSAKDYLDGNLLTKLLGNPEEVSILREILDNSADTQHTQFITQQADKMDKRIYQEKLKQATLHAQEKLESIKNKYQHARNRQLGIKSTDSASTFWHKNKNPIIPAE